MLLLARLSQALGVRECSVAVLLGRRTLVRVSSLSVPVRLVVVAMAAGLVGACVLAIASSPGARVLLTVTPRVALVDQPVSITVSNLIPESTVTLTARTTDQRGNGWRSIATFATDAGGDVVVAEAPSMGGTSRRTRWC